MVGKGVRVTGTQVERVTFRGRQVGGRLTFAETYVKRGAGWQILKSSLDR
jgi:hypothetical protein